MLPIFKILMKPTYYFFKITHAFDILPKNSLANPKSRRSTLFFFLLGVLWFSSDIYILPGYYFLLCNGHHIQKVVYRNNLNLRMTVLFFPSTHFL